MISDRLSNSLLVYALLIVSAAIAAAGQAAALPIRKSHATMVLDTIDKFIVPRVDALTKNTAATAWSALAAEFRGLDEYQQTISVAVNEEYAKFSTPLKDGDEVAFLPPVSGG